MRELEKLVKEIELLEPIPTFEEVANSTETKSWIEHEILISDEWWENLGDF